MLSSSINNKLFACFMSLYFSVHLVLFALHSFAEPIKMLTAASVVSHRLDGPTARITPMNVSCIANKKKKNKKKYRRESKYTERQNSEHLPSISSGPPLMMMMLSSSAVIEDCAPAGANLVRTTNGDRPIWRNGPTVRCSTNNGV